MQIYNVELPNSELHQEDTLMLGDDREFYEEIS